MSGIAALTTTFTPPASCLTDLMRATPLSGSTAEDQLGPSPSATECYPSGYKFDVAFYYSPGLCPSAYATVSQGTNQIGTLVETVANCCPTDFSWTNDGLYLTTCVSHYGASETATRTVAAYSGTSSAGDFVVGGGGYAIASMVQVRYQATDQSILQPGSATATVTSTVTVKADAEGLSTGAKVGLGVGVPIAVLLLIAIGVGMLLFRQRKHRYKAAPQENTIYNAEKTKDPGGEIDGAPVAEVPDSRRVFELNWAASSREIVVMPEDSPEPGRDW